MFKNNVLKLKLQPIQETQTYTIAQSSQVKSFLANEREGAFGIEYFQNRQTKKMNFFSNVMSPINEPPTRPIILDPFRPNQSCFYFHFQQQSFLPFSFKHRDDFWDLLEKNLKKQIEQGAKIFLQIMCEFKPDERWKVEAYDKYNNYLDGIKNPSSNKHILKMQYKLLDFLKPSHKPFEIGEVMDKLEQNGFEIVIRLIVEGEDDLRIKVVDKVQLVLNYSRFANAWSRMQVNNKQKFIENAQTRVFPRKYKNQILCPSELQFFFGGGEVNKEKISLKPVSKLIIENKPQVSTTLKPTIVDAETETIIDDLTLAMKKLKLLRDEELKIVDFKNSLTLSMISFERPAEVTIEKLRKRIEDFEIEMHVEGISFEQGTQKGSIAFMYPRKDRQYIPLEELIEDNEFKLFSSQSNIPLIFGVDMMGNPLYFDMVELIHLLNVGATGMGKSNFLNCLLHTLTYINNPNKLELYLIDLKRVELSEYKKLPHVKKFAPTSNKAFLILEDIVNEMEERYEILENYGFKKISQYNNKYKDNPWAYKIIVIDEFAELIMVNRDVEDFVVRINQLGRACGIHMIICTQRASVDVVTGLIKANMPTRVSFTCESHHDYKTVLDRMPPFRLVGNGDGVMKWHGNSTEFLRFQSPFVSDKNFLGKVIEKWGVGNNTINTDENEEDIDDKYLLLKKVICETGETRNKQLQEMTRLSPNKISEYMKSLVDEGWIERSGSKQNGFKLTLSEEECQEFLSELITK